MTNPEAELRKDINILIHSWFAVDYSGGDITDKELKLLENSIYILLNLQRQEWVSELEKFLFPMKEEREVYCPKEDKRVKEYFSHHDLDHFCEDCGSKLKERTVLVRDYGYDPEEYQIRDYLAHLKEDQ